MKKAITFCFILLAFSLIFAQKSREEQMLDGLINAGMVHKEGNRMIFKVKKASDTATVKMMYGVLFKNNNWDIGFDVDGKYYSNKKPIANTSIITQNGNTPTTTSVYTQSVEETATITSPISTSDQRFFEIGSFLIRNARDYRYLTIKDYGPVENSPTFMNSYDANPNKQQWKLVPLNNGFYKIQAQGGLCLTFGLVPHLKPFTNTDNQLWKLEDTGDGFYYISTKNNLSMFLTRPKNVENGGVSFRKKSETIEEKWHLIKWTDDGRRMTTFSPENNVFRFINTFNGEDFIRWGGLCGGMVYAALDYFNKGLAIPKQYYTPANETTLQSYLYGRQQHSIWDVNSNWSELEVSYNTRGSEIFRWGIQGTGGGRLQELKTSVDANKSVPIGLFAGGILGKDNVKSGRHVVLGVGYATGRYTGDLGSNKGDYKIFVYNPNNRNVVRTLVPDLAKECYFEVETGYAWRTYFVNKRYAAHNPPNGIANYPEGQEEGSVRHLYATFVTSNDDLRGGNDNINITIKFKDGTEQRHLNVNGGARWVDNSFQTVHLTLNRTVKKEDIQEFVIGFTGASNIVAADNWNLHTLTIYSGHGGINYANVEASTGSTYYFRFSQSNRFLTIPVLP